MCFISQGRKKVIATQRDGKRATHPPGISKVNQVMERIRGNTEFVCNFQSHCFSHLYSVLCGSRTQNWLAFLKLHHLNNSSRYLSNGENRCASPSLQCSSSRGNVAVTWTSHSKMGQSWGYGGVKLRQHHLRSPSGRWRGFHQWANIHTLSSPSAQWVANHCWKHWSNAWFISLAFFKELQVNPILPDLH